MSRKVKFTTFYIPGIHKDLTFKDKLDNIPDLDFSEEDKEIGQEDNPIEGGVLYDAWTQNKSYKQLIDKVGINWKSVTELMNFYEWGSNDVEMCEQNLILIVVIEKKHRLYSITFIEVLVKQKFEDFDPKKFVQSGRWSEILKDAWSWENFQIRSILIKAKCSRKYIMTLLKI